TITEYWPVPESWFRGRLVSAPGLDGKHRIDWLYSAAGLSMEGDGVGLDGRRYHVDTVSPRGWVTKAGHRSKPSASGWSPGPPYWRNGAFWRNASGWVTFPLEPGGWSNGRGRRYAKQDGTTFA